MKERKGKGREKKELKGMDRKGKGREEDRKDEIQTQCFNGEDAWAFDY